MVRAAQLNRGEEVVFEEELLDELKNLRRRYALFYLNQQEQPVHLHELSQRIAAWETNCAMDEVDYEHRRSVYNALHQRHLPRLEQLGIVAYDTREKTIALTERGNAFELYLASDLVGVFWHKYYLVITGVGAVALGLEQLNVGPFAELPGGLLILLVLIALTVVALLHYSVQLRWRELARENTPDLIIEFDDG